MNRRRKRHGPVRHKTPSPKDHDGWITSRRFNHVKRDERWCVTLHMLSNCGGPGSIGRVRSPAFMSGRLVGQAS